MLDIEMHLLILYWLRIAQLPYLKKNLLQYFKFFFLLLFTVSCSTVTVTKCQAALRTLQAFPFFRPTCLCKEPGVDPDCNHFRDFLFDHPCGFVLKKGNGNTFIELLFHLLPSSQKILQNTLCNEAKGFFLNRRTAKKCWNINLFGV